MNLDKIKEIVKEELIIEINKVGYICDSDNVDRLVNTLIKKNIQFVDAPEDIFYKLEEDIRDFLKQKYYQVGEILKNGNYIGYFTREKYYSIDEFNKKNNIED